MNNSSSKKRVTRQDLKKKSKDKKVKNTRANEEGMKREKKKDREGKKMMLEWAMLKKMWKKKQENISSTSSEGQKEAKGLQWCKYSVMKRRTESLLDLAEKKGALRQGFGQSFGKSRPQKLKKFRRREKRGDCNLLKKVLYQNHINFEKEDSYFTE